MKKLTKVVLSTALILASATGAFAQQNFRTAYFIDGYAQRYKFNPAFAYERNFVSLALANTNASFESNASLSSMIAIPKDLKAQSFMSAEFPMESFMSKLNDVNKLNAGVGVDLLTAGFWTGKIFHTIDLSVRGDMSVSIPKDVLQMMKNCASGQEFKVGDVNGAFSAWLEAGYGISGEVYDGVRLGARVKFLAAAGRMDMSSHNTVLTPDGVNKWTVTSENEMHTYFPGGMRFVTHGEHGDVTPGNPIYDFVKFKDMQKPASTGEYFKKIPGYGMSVDFGLSADFAEYFNISASVSDLGFIKWGRHRAAYNPSTPWTFTGFDGNLPAEKSLKDQFSDINDMLDECYAFVYDDGCKGENYLAAKIELLTVNANLGFRAKMPFYDRLSLGLLGTYRHNNYVQMYEGRFNATVSPLDWLDLAVDYAYSNFGHSAGFAANFHCKGINVFFGTDSLIPIFAMKKGIPQSKTNTNLTFGVNVAFGDLHK